MPSIIRLLTVLILLNILKQCACPAHTLFVAIKGLWRFITTFSLTSLHKFVYVTLHLILSRIIDPGIVELLLVTLKSFAKEYLARVLIALVF